MESYCSLCVLYSPQQVERDCFNKGTKRRALICDKNPEFKADGEKNMISRRIYLSLLRNALSHHPRSSLQTLQQNNGAVYFTGTRACVCVLERAL